jgi:hypothetical protein
LRSERELGEAYQVRAVLEQLAGELAAGQFSGSGILLERQADKVRRAYEKGNMEEWLWKQQCPDASQEAFIFPDKKGGLMDTGNYRKRILHKLARNLELPKLTFQVIRRTIATLAQKKGTVKDVQGVFTTLANGDDNRRLHARDSRQCAGDGECHQRRVAIKTKFSEG